MGLFVFVSENGKPKKLKMNELKTQRLNPEVSVSDGGSGLLNGIHDAFETCFIQKDLFHNLKELGGPLYMLDRKALSFLKELYEP